ncbi:MAG: cytochrome o ubiquinol oxidase subunit IV [Steroidobacteraceae bacterium]
MNDAQIHSNDPTEGSLSSYLLGFAYALILTAAAFWMAMSGGVSRTAALVGVSVLAVVQIAVHLVFFLHMNRSADARWNRMAFLFAVIIIGILVAGSLWIMNHLHQNMMPMLMD